MADEVVNSAVQGIAQANHLFTFDLYKVLAQDTGNLFFSSLSIQIILALVFFGARGNTSQQLARGLRLPDDKNVTENGFSAIMNRLLESEEIILKIANAVFLKKGFGINEEFNHTAGRFKAGIEQVDFDQAELARERINEWVGIQTNQTIKNIIGQGVLNEYTRMLLVNAIYFKGRWLRKFRESDTSRQPFYLDSGLTTEVDMMYTKNNFKYTELDELDSQILSLPYKGRTNMLILLPRQVKGLPSLERNLTGFNVENILSRMTNRNVKVYLPKYKLNYNRELKGSLIKLGITDMFGRNADLTRISDEPLSVDNVFHKSFIEVNELGTEAAAATGVLIARKKTYPRPEEEPIIFKADHPFIFLILDCQTKIVLFAGRYTTPPS